MICDCSQLDAIVFDFDGVLTDNRVWTDQDGREMVACSRADGLAFDVLRRLPLKLFILSTEQNPVVSARAKKLKVAVFQGVGNKKEALQELARERGFSLARTLYVGNDLNDMPAIEVCGFSACPADSHPRVIEAATFRLKQPGGNGAVRELVEHILCIDVSRYILAGREKS